MHYRNRPIYPLDGFVSGFRQHGAMSAILVVT
jgi:hypothetical protein